MGSFEPVVYNAYIYLPKQIKMENNTIVLFEYTRNGVVYTTPNELIAMLRAQDGKYFSVEYTL